MAVSNMEEYQRWCVAPGAAKGSNLSLIRCKLAEFTLEDVSEGAFIKIL